MARMSCARLAPSANTADANGGSLSDRRPLGSSQLVKKRIKSSDGYLGRWAIRMSHDVFCQISIVNVSVMAHRHQCSKLQAL